MIACYNRRNLLTAVLFSVALALAAGSVRAGDPCPEAAVLACGELLDGALEAGDCPLELNGRSDGTRFDRFGLALEGPRRFTVTLRSEAFDAFLYLLGPDGRERAFDDDGARADDGSGESDARVDFTALDAGPYAVRVNHFFPGGAGAYTIELACDAIVREVLFSDGFEAEVRRSDG